MRLTPMPLKVLQLLLSSPARAAAYGALDRLERELRRPAAASTIHQALDFLIAREAGPLDREGQWLNSLHPPRCRLGGTITDLPLLQCV